MTATIPSTDRDTICAISTPPGVGGIAVIRVSGDDAVEIVDRIRPRGRRLGDTPSHTALVSTVVDAEGNDLDRPLITIMRGPKSYTGQDTVELSVHGSTYIQHQLLKSLISAGCRMAEPGEFTRRAFAAGHLDLAQAEAVADLIAASSAAAHRVALNQMKGQFSQRLAGLREQLLDLSVLLELELDFSDQDVMFADRDRLVTIATEINREVTRLANSFDAGQVIKQGIPTAIVGPTNAGKSTLLNHLVGDDRAIVSDIHGTTRDTIEELIAIGPYTFRLIDTAGLRDTDDAIERIGIDRSRRAMIHARIIICVIDRTSPLDLDTFEAALNVVNPDSPTSPAHLIVALNKSDLGDAEPTITERLAAVCAPLSAAHPNNLHVVEISGLTGEGIDTLRQALEEIARHDTGDIDTDIIVTNARHADSLRRAAESSQRVISALKDGLSGDLIAQDLRLTIHHLADITGQIPSTDILATIFSRFCIGK